MARDRGNGNRAFNRGGVGSVAGRDVEDMNPVMVQQYLEGVHYPCNRSNLLRTAREHDAPPNVMDALQKISNKNYSSPVDVTKELGQHM